MICRRCGNAMTFREAMKNLLFVVYVLHDDMMNGWFHYITMYDG